MITQDKKEQHLKDVLSQFRLEGAVKKIKPLGNGLINDTYKVETEGTKEEYVLQRINNSVFTDVELLQYNIVAVTNHIRKKLLAKGEKDIDRKVLRFIETKDGKTYYFDGEAYWRISVFIPDAVTYETVNPKYSYFAGNAFGAFEAMLEDIPEKLGETIPDFHNMELRIRQLDEAIEKDAVGRISGKVKEGTEDHSEEVRDFIKKIREKQDEMCKAERLHREGKLPKRICHCDTKVNNMMFDKEGNVLCVIDLDTVMPSFIFSDFGDFLRTAANTLPEDDPQIDKVEFKMDIFEAFAKGYLESASSFLTDIERENLPYAACLFPYMQAVRFLTDYINGDTYYKIKYPEHNLVRTRNQFKLFESAESKIEEMKKIIAK